MSAKCVAEAELVEWMVKVGDPCARDMMVAAVMTDKATVEIPSPVSGTVVWLGGVVGDTIAVKAPLIRIATDAGAGEPAAAEASESAPANVPAAQGSAKRGRGPPSAKGRAACNTIAAPGGSRHPPSTSRWRRPLSACWPARTASDLRLVRGTGPADASCGKMSSSFLPAAPIPPRGLRSREENRAGRDQADRPSAPDRRENGGLHLAHSPHHYVEEVDVTALEELRAKMNAERRSDQPKLTLLPFLMRALVKAVVEEPDVNATFDDEAGLLTVLPQSISALPPRPRPVSPSRSSNTPRRAASGIAPAR